MKFVFSHEGYFTNDFEASSKHLLDLGYKLEKDAFEPDFNCHNYLYQNGNHFVELVTAKSNTKNQHYHTAFYVKSLKDSLEFFQKKKALPMFDSAYSVLWDAKIAFILTADHKIIELIEDPNV